jgi:two-component system LytT family response regulator
VPLFSLWGKEIALQEDNMRARRTSSQSLKSILGAGVFALGLRLLFVNLERVARIEPYRKDSRLAILSDGTRLPVSRAGYARLKALLDERPFR